MSVIEAAFEEAIDVDVSAIEFRTREIESKVCEDTLWLATPLGVMMLGIQDKKRAIIRKTTTLNQAGGSDPLICSFSSGMNIAAICRQVDGRRTRVKDFDKDTCTFITTTTPMTSQILSPDGSKLAQIHGGDSDIALWDVAKQECHMLSEGANIRLSYLVFSADGNMLAAVTNWSDIHLWNVTLGDGKAMSCTAKITGKFAAFSSPMSLGDKYMQALAFSRDGQKIAYANDDARRILLWSIPERKDIQTAMGFFLPKSYYIRALAWSPHGKTFVSGACYGLVHMWDAITGDCLHSLNESASTPNNRIMTLAVSASGARVAAAQYMPHDRTFINVWDVPSNHNAKNDGFDPEVAFDGMKNAAKTS